MRSSNSVIRAGDDLSGLQEWTPVEFEQEQLFSNELIYNSALTFFGIKPGEVKEQTKNLVKAGKGELVFQSWQPGDMNSINSNENEEDLATTSWAPFLEQPNPRKIADQIILDAKAQAEEIIRNAKTTASQIKEDAFNKGNESAKTEMHESLQAAASVINVAREWRIDMMNQAEPMIMDLVKKMAQKMFGDGVELDNAALQQHFASVLESARSLGDLRVYMNPQDARLLGPDWREYQASMLGNKVEIASNDSIKQGGCYIQGEWGTADALVETQLAAILNQFSEVEQPEKGRRLMQIELPDISRYSTALNEVSTTRNSGKVVQVLGLTIEAIGLDCQIGEVCLITTNLGVTIMSEVIGFKEERVLLMPLGDMQGIQPGSTVFPISKSFKAPVGTVLLGRVLDGLGQPMDGGPSLDTVKKVSTYAIPPHPLERAPITSPLVTGVRVIDGLLTCGKGQRMGIFAGSGVGKSTLMGALARSSRSDVSVIALVGERGREVREFLERDLGPEGLARSVVVVSTSDQPALVRLKAASIAMTIAEHFRDLGMDVTFLMDSVTRFAMAQREIGLAIGEPPASKGYTPSVFALLPRLLERAGAGKIGTITGFFTVLVEGDDFNEPICDAARGILDGHIILSRELAARNHYPAIDVLSSVSRVMPAVTSRDHLISAGQARKHLATYEKARDLINIGAYVSGSDPEIDAAIRVMPTLTGFLQQNMRDVTPFEDTLNTLMVMRSEEV